MTIIKFKNFINLTDTEKLLVLRWRNSDRVRLKMNNNEIINLENHMKWIANLQKVSDSLYFLFEVDTKPVGVFDYINCTTKTCECGSYIGDEEYKGYGIILNYYGFEYAFKNLGVDRINISVLKSNKRVYQMHKMIFNACDDGDDENNYHLYLDKNNFLSVSNKILGYFNNIASVKWDV